MTLISRDYLTSTTQGLLALVIVFHTPFLLAGATEPESEFFIGMFFSFVSFVIALVFVDVLVWGLGKNRFRRVM